MNCDENRRLLEAYVDGELDPAHHAQVESHLETCEACARMAQSLSGARTLLKASLPRSAASDTLTERLRAALPRASAPLVRERRNQGLFAGWLSRGLAAAIAIGSLSFAYQWGARSGATDRLVDAAVDNHIRSLLAAHLMDVVSTDQHTVKPWFNGKIDFAPPVIDLAEQGFPLAGGRLEHIEGEPAAALVYHRHKHVINLLIWPTERGPAVIPRSEHDGYQLRGWKTGSLSFLAISDIPAADLAEFAEALQSQTK